MPSRIYPYIILLSGTPGTGKTCIANSLNMQKNWKIFALGDFILKKKLYSLDESNSNIKNIDIEAAAIEAARTILSDFLDSEVVLVDSHYADIVMDGFDEINSEKGNEVAKMYTRGDNILGIICRCHPVTLENRLIQRKYPRSKIMENIQAEILAESTHNMAEVLDKNCIFEIDTSAHSIMDISHTIKEMINSLNNDVEVCDESLQKIGIIDWISELYNEGTLNTYFKEDLGERVSIDLDETEKNDQGEKK